MGPLGSSINVDKSTLTAVAVFLILFSLVTCFSGYRVFRLYLTILGFLVGFALGASLGYRSPDATAVVFGIIGGIVGMVLINLLYVISIILAGAGTGILIAYALMTPLNSTHEGAMIAMAVGGILGGFLALVLAKLIIMLSTAFSGAVGIVYGVLFLLPGSAVLIQPGFAVIVTLPKETSLVAVTLAWIILGTMGFIVQFRTSRRRLAG